VSLKLSDDALLYSSSHGNFTETFVVFPYYVMTLGPPSLLSYKEGVLHEVSESRVLRRKLKLLLLGKPFQSVIPPSGISLPILPFAVEYEKHCT
jgi:hypothetical protein